MEDIDFIIGIASYKRPEPKQQQTLAYLEWLKFPRERIWMSVQTEEDLKAYTDSGIADRVGRLIYRPATSAGGNRNTLLQELHVGDKIVFMDDDINSVETINLDANGNYLHKHYEHKDKSYKFRRKIGLRGLDTLEEFVQTLKYGFYVAEQCDTRVWGITSARNPWFMHTRREPMTKTICTTQMMGVIYDGEQFNEAYKLKEDYDFCCRIIRKYGACIRLTDVTLSTEGSGESGKGGCSDVWKNERLRIEMTAKMLALYPDILKPHTTRPHEVLVKYISPRFRENAKNLDSLLEN